LELVSRCLEPGIFRPSFFCKAEEVFVESRDEPIPRSGCDAAVVAPTPDGLSYWLTASNGGIFTFGDAPLRGSLGGHSLNQPVIGMARD
jgi:hypothetical protein